MKKSGFTLIEIFIVILIVGILAAVAFTQYQNITEKSRYAEAYSVLTQIRAAQLKYYERNNKWASSFSEIAVDRVPIGINEVSFPLDMHYNFYFGYCLDHIDASTPADSATAYRLYQNEYSKKPGVPLGSPRTFLRVNYTSGNFTKSSGLDPSTDCGYFGGY